MKQICSLSFVAALVMLPRLAAPHHSMAEWDTSVIDEMQGEIVNSALLPDRTEVLLRGLGPAVDPHWPNARAVIGTGEWGTAEAVAAEPRGLFTVWRSVRGVGGREPLSLTQEAEAVLATWNVADNWVVRCERRGMPATMGNPYPREFVDEGDRIVLRIEEHDNVRVIHLSGDADPGAQPASRLGYSVVRWEGDRTLVVSTTRIDFPWYNTTGGPQSEDVTVHERFTAQEQSGTIKTRDSRARRKVRRAPGRSASGWRAR